MIGTRIGPYEIIELIGTGGMGAVYLAERRDPQFHKKVAIKVVRAAIGRPALVRRFEIERQTLAALDHPHIVRLIDAGVTHNQLSYLVMDYVDGVPIDEFAAPLQLRRRLELFLDVCAAVQYAHQKLVVHCDLKPGNILVTSDGQVRLLDFGIAKILSDADSDSPPATQTGFRPFTPEYASPEQLKGAPIGTSTDVYSLGVVLFVIATGDLPYNLKTTSPAELVQQICVEEPRKASAAATHATTGGDAANRPETAALDPRKIRAQLQGDLDSILAMALRKEPQWRYGSVEHFAADIRRHLDGLPVSARRNTFGYRAQKFLARNRVWVSAAALVAMTIVAGIAGVVRQEHIAQVERAKAERRFNDLHKMARSMLFDVDEKIRNLRGSLPARQLLVQEALQYLDGLYRESGGDPRFQSELIDGYIRVGDLQGNPSVPNIGAPKAALASYTKAHALAQAAVAANPHSWQALIDLSETYEKLADIEAITGRLPRAVADAGQAVKILEGLHPPADWQLPVWKQLSSNYEALADVTGGAGIASLGDHEGALAAYRKGLAIDQRILATNPSDARGLRGVAVLRLKIGGILELRNDNEGARKMYEEARDGLHTLVLADPDNASNRRAEGMAQRKLAGLLAERDPQAGLVAYKRAIAMQEKMVEIAPNNQSHMDLAVNLQDLAVLYQSMGKLPEAIATMQRMDAVLGAMARASPSDMLVKGRLASIELRIGVALGEAHRSGEAARYSLRSIAMLKEMADAAPRDPDALDDYADALLICEPPTLRRPRLALAVALKEVALSDGSWPLDTLGRAYFALGDRKKAIETEEKALKVAESEPDRASSVPRVQDRLKEFRAGRPGN
jgi:eukaryotic-like serine/threonine-protein kinase